MFQVKNREHLEALEESTLAPYASLGRLSKGRRHREEEHPYCSVYQRDRDRIVHSNAFRRMEFKTQVFVYYEGDHYRNRLSHSLEVAVVGRALARMLQLNEDLIEAIALAHDLGHSPFGHSGERVLNDVMGEWGGFEHNRQSLRVVEVIEHRHPGFRGLNLTWEVREGMAKHSSEYDQPLEEDYGPGRFPSLEAQVVNLSDEIAYTNHDLDDGLNSGLLSPRRLGEVPLWGEQYREVKRLHSGEGFRQICYATIRRLINLLVENAARTTLGNIGDMGIESPDDVREAQAPAVALEGDLEGKFGELKAFLNENLYQHYRVRRMAVKAERILRELFALYSTDRSLLPGNLKVHLAGHVPERVICDYLAGMTDRYAIREYRKLFNPEENI